MLYLDHAATTPLRPEAAEAAAPFLTADFGNPSGVHELSRRAKNAVEAARERAAELLGASHPLEVVFTGGGTEADNLAIVGAALASPARTGVVTSAVEHKAVLESAAFIARLGGRAAVVAVGPDAVVDPAAVLAALGPDTAVVSVMAANNEVGVLQPVSEIADHVHGRDEAVVVHTDAVQAFVSEDVTSTATGADLISLAAHKLGGPKGVGLLYVRRGVELEPVIHGGGQELGRRSGTHNVAGIIGMVAAMEATVRDREAFRRRVGAARDRFETVVADKLADVEVTAAHAPRLVQHSHVRFRGIRSDAALIRLDRAGIAAGAGSACQSGAITASHVLTAMGWKPEAAAECMRFTFGWPDAAADGERAALAVVEALGTVR
jgi:cysteine desulfurase